MIVTKSVLRQNQNSASHTSSEVRSLSKCTINKLVGLIFLCIVGFLGIALVSLPNQLHNFRSSIKTPSPNDIKSLVDKKGVLKVDNSLDPNQELSKNNIVFTNNVQK